MADNAEAGRKAAAELYRKLYAAALPKYVGPGKRFKDEAEFKSWVTGQGHGFEEALGRGALGDDDPEIARLARYALGQSNNVTDGAYSTWAGKDPEFRDIYAKYDVAPGQDAEQVAFQSRQNDLDSQRQRILAKVQAFADEMNMPVDQLLKNDDFARSLRDMTYGQSSDQALVAGAGAGGLSAINSDLNTKRALLGYQMQRQQMGQSALQSAYAGLTGISGEMENTRRYEQDLNMQFQQAQAAAQQQAYAQKQGQYGQILGAVGAGVGAYYGGAAGAAAGGQIGSSLGGLAAGQYKPYQYKYPSVGARGSGGSGLGSAKYGGNY